MWVRIVESKDKSFRPSDILYDFHSDDGHLTITLDELYNVRPDLKDDSNP